MMGLFGKRAKRKKEETKIDSDTLICFDITDEETVKELDFGYSQSIYDRNLIGVFSYEIETVSQGGDARRGELFTGEFVEMTDGKMELGIRKRIGEESPFSCENGLNLSYSRHGESFFVEAKIIKAAGDSKEAADVNGGNGESQPEESDEPSPKWEYCLVEILLCAEPLRHRRRHGRVAIEWNVYYCQKLSGQDSDPGDDECPNYTVTKTIDISEGGFKSIVEKQLAKNTEICCVVEVDNHTKSEGALTGKVIRCDYLADSVEMYEMTVQFVEMDDSVREFLAGCIGKEIPGAVDSEAVITISDDGLEATLQLTTPRNNGADLTYDELCARLEDEGITYGIDSDVLKALSEKPYYNLEEVIARGTPPTDGTDAKLTYCVNMNPEIAPKVLEDGSVDFKDLGLIQQVKKDDVLVEKTPSTEGTAGTCVTGDACEAKPGKDKKLPAGANTVTNEDGTALLAEMDGGVSIVDDKINVFDSFVVEGDVHYETGSISHNGIVIVKGDVRYGFAVDATGDVVIQGTVESATVNAGGSLIIKGGCIGDESVIGAGGNVAAKFIEGGSYSIRGDLQTSYIIGSTVKCGGSINMIGGGIIRNSHVIAQTTVEAKVIGSMRAAADKTVVEVGNDPELLNRYLAATKKLEQLEKDRETYETTIRALTIKKYRNELSAEKLRVLEKTKVFEKHFSIQLEELSDECKALKEQINALGFGTIRVQNTAYEGLRIIIGSSTLVLKDSVRAVKFHRNEEGVTFSPLK